MSEHYCVLSIQKEHTFNGLQTRRKHNRREADFPHVDITLTPNNRELVETYGLTYRELWDKRIKEIEMETGKPVAKKKNSVLAYEMIATFTREADVDIEKWIENNKRWFFDTFGEKNVIAMDLHMDEATPHIHAIIVPIDERNRLCAKSFTGTPLKLKEMHTSYGKYMAPLGLMRGEIASKSKKRDLNRFYAGLNKAANATVPTIEEGEPVSSYTERINAYIQGRELEMYSKELKLKRKVELEQTKFAQYKYKYREATKLYDEISESFDNNKEMTNERLGVYRVIEKSVPRKTLSTLLENIIKKFPIAENIIHFFSKNKKKKKVSDDIENLPR